MGGVKVRVKVVRLVCYACEDGSNSTLIITVNLVIFRVFISFA